MKVVILAGGLGTRISEESILIPKPMIKIGDDSPIIWHIMKIYSYYGFDDFIICAGYKQHVIKEWFANYYLHNSNVTFDFKNDNQFVVHNNHVEKWKITVVDTGLNTMTGGRIKRIRDYVDNERFHLTYGDGVADVNILSLIKHHETCGGKATLTAIQPVGRFGVLDISEDKIVSFREKEKRDMGWINGGFMVLEPEIFDYIEDDNTTFEDQPLVKLAEEGNLYCYKHCGFWQCMDTLRDKEKLEEMWRNNKAPWKLWD